VLVTNQQLYLLIGIPMLFNAGLIGLLLALVNAKFDAQNAKFESRFDAVNIRLDAIDQRFTDMRELWRSELHRVEGVLDARLKHLEERLTR
jgi:hypothetical protein